MTEDRRDDVARADAPGDGTPDEELPVDVREGEAVAEEPAVGEESEVPAEVDESAEEPTVGEAEVEDAPADGAPEDEEDPVPAEDAPVDAAPEDEEDPVDVREGETVDAAPEDEEDPVDEPAADETTPAEVTPAETALVGTGPRVVRTPLAERWRDEPTELMPSVPAEDATVVTPGAEGRRDGTARPLDRPSPAVPPPRETRPDLLWEDEEPTPPRRRRLLPLAIVAAVVVVLGGLYVGALWAWAERVPPGTTVAGVAIGGLAADEAVAVLDAALEPVATDDIVVAAGERRTSLSPDDAGLSFDPWATVDTVTGLDLRPIRLWEQLFGRGPAEPVTDVDVPELRQAVEDASGSLSVAPVDGTVTFVDGEPHATPPEDGVAVDVDASVELLAVEWLTAARPIELPTEIDPPTIDEAEIERAMTTLARPLARAPVSVAVADQVAELPASVVTGAASFVPEDGSLTLHLHGETLVQAVVDRTRDLLSEPEDARFEFRDGAPTIVAGEPGTTLDPDELAQAVAAAGTSSDRTARVQLVERDPEESTAELEALGVEEIVGEFSTPLTAEPRRTQNIRNGAQNITGTLIRPGEVFSLTEALGPIDAAHGYVQAGAIVNGEHVDAWGGGLSQVSTTTYNAAYFAGFEIVEHTPHSEWFARYPEGREATIFTGVIDMRWRNNTPHGALVQAWVEGGRLHVRIWGTEYWTVESFTSGRSAVVQPTTVYSQSPTCEPQSAGNPGFTVTVTRVVLREGEEYDRESWTVRYRPQNRVICGPAPGERDEETRE